MIDNPLPRTITGRLLALSKEHLERDLDIYLECHKKLNLDAMVLYPFIWGHGTKQLNEKDYVDAWGAIWRAAEFPTQCGTSYVRGIIRTSEDLETFQPPNPQEVIDAFLQVERKLKKISNEIPLVAAVVGGFLTGSEMRTHVNMLSDLYLNPDITEKLIGMVHKYNMTVLSAMVDLGFEAVLLDDDLRTVRVR